MESIAGSRFKTGLFRILVRLRDASTHRTRLAVEPAEDVAEDVNSEEVDAKDCRS